MGDTASKSHPTNTGDNFDGVGSLETIFHHQDPPPPAPLASKSSYPQAYGSLRRRDEEHRSFPDDSDNVQRSINNGRYIKSSAGSSYRTLPSKSSRNKTTSESSDRYYELEKTPAVLSESSASAGVESEKGKFSSVYDDGDFSANKLCPIKEASSVNRTNWSQRNNPLRDHLLKFSKAGDITWNNSRGSSPSSDLSRTGSEVIVPLLSDKDRESAV